MYRRKYFFSISHNLDIIFTIVFRASKQQLPMSNHTLNTPGIEQCCFNGVPDTFNSQTVNFILKPPKVIEPRSKSGTLLKQYCSITLTTELVPKTGLLYPNIKAILSIMDQEKNKPRVQLVFISRDFA